MSENTAGLGYKAPKQPAPNSSSLPGETISDTPYGGSNDNEGAQVSGDDSTGGHFESTAEGQPKWVAGSKSAVNAKNQQ